LGLIAACFRAGSKHPRTQIETKFPQIARTLMRLNGLESLRDKPKLTPDLLDAMAMLMT
jgi:hypothetical protein